MSTANTINTNVAAIHTGNIYTKNTTAMTAAMTRVATAQKINSAKDNASVWAITEKMRDRIRANDQANQNIQNDSALLRTAQDGMGNTLSILETLKERAIASANDSNVSSDRTKIVEEVNQLVRQIDDNAAKVKFNGRQLLNGGVESTSGSITSSTGTVSANGITATGTYADKAVYGITGLQQKNGTAISSTNASGVNLVDLVGKNGETLFQVGDKITLNWTDNGVEKNTIISVGATTKVSAIDATSAGLTGTFKDAADSTGATDSNGNPVTAGAAGLYLTGAANHNISGLSISVTTSDGQTRVSAQEALEPTALAQSYGDSNRGSNAVFSMTVTASGGLIAGDQTSIYALGVADKDLASTTVDITINDTKLTFAGSTSLEDISKAFKEKGINVELHYAENAGDTLTYEGNTVTKGTYGSTAVYNDTTAKSLNFVAGSDQDISYIKVVSEASDSGFLASKKFETGIASSALTKVMAQDDTGTSGTTSTNSTMLPQGSALQFFVGGEQNFGVNFTIGKATSGNLLGMSADAFANKFATKEGAESALSIVDNAIDKVLTEQTRLGSMERRLGFTSDNIVSMNENLEAGYSAYRDSDIAKEMTQYMKYAVLSQSAQYMLSQANQNPFQVLNLLSQ